MSPNFQALCYLTAWEKGLAIEGGLAWESQLRKCRLDYSWASLNRIDLFLDALRKQRAPVFEEFISKSDNVNLLMLLAFYVVELRSRVSGERSAWYSYQELLEKDPSTAAHGKGFASTIISVLDGAQFLPLVSICTRLFEANPDKSVAFSAGLLIREPADKHRQFAPLNVDSLIPQFSEKYTALAIPIGYRRWIESPVPPGMPESDQLIRLGEDAAKLLRSGRVVWGAIVQV